MHGVTWPKLSAQPDEPAPRSLTGTWQLKIIHASDDRRADVDGVLWLSLHDDGSAQFATCQKPAFDAAGKLGCASELICSAGGYRYDRRALVVRDGLQQRSGRVNLISGGWVWIGDYLGPQGASGTFYPSELPAICQRK